MDEKRREDHDENFGIGHMILRIIVSAIVLSIAAFLTPGFSIAGIWPLIIAAVVIGVLDYLVVRFTRFNASPFGRGVVGFIVAAIIIYLTGYIVPGVYVTFWGAIIAAFVIGIVDMLIPGKQVF